MFGIRNLREPRELSQPNQLDMVGPSGRFSNFFIHATWLGVYFSAVYRLNLSSPPMSTSDMAEITGQTF